MSLTDKLKQSGQKMRKALIIGLADLMLGGCSLKSMYTSNADSNIFSYRKNAPEFMNEAYQDPNLIAWEKDGNRFYLGKSISYDYDSSIRSALTNARSKVVYDISGKFDIPPSKSYSIVKDNIGIIHLYDSYHEKVSEKSEKNHDAYWRSFVVIKISSGDYKNLIKEAEALRE